MNKNIINVTKVESWGIDHLHIFTNTCALYNIIVNQFLLFGFTAWKSIWNINFLNSLQCVNTPTTSFVSNRFYDTINLAKINSSNHSRRSHHETSFDLLGLNSRWEVRTGDVTATRHASTLCNHKAIGKSGEIWWIYRCYITKSKKKS